jgi:hypothetical protein
MQLQATPDSLSSMATGSNPEVHVRPARLLLLLWFGTVVTLLFARWGYYFESPVHEHGDLALNAIQIDRAKDFAELHGNYSRFRFHHPGPAFFYVYAAAETLLCDWLRLPLTPFNAHSLAGLALQAFFFSLGLTLAARMVRQRLLRRRTSAWWITRFGASGRRMSCSCRFSLF